MGLKGTDVAKEAADMVILDDDFSTIMAAVEEGKAIFYNIKNFLTFQLSTSVAALSIVAVANLTGMPNPLNAMQILWINIIMDGPPAQSLGVEPVDASVAKRPPRHKDEAIISTLVMQRVMSSALLIVLGTLYVHSSEIADARLAAAGGTHPIAHDAAVWASGGLEGGEGGGGGVTRRDTTMTFTTFVMFDMMNALACRSMDTPVYALAQGFFSNKPFLWSVGGSLVGQLLVIYWAPMQGVFQTEALSLGDLAFILCLTSSMLVLDTLRKLANGGGGLSGSGTGTGHDAQAIGSMMNLRSNKKKKKKQKSERVEAPSSNKASFTPFGGKNVDSMV